MGNIECLSVEDHFKDRTRNGRTPRGERNRHAKLTAKEVRRIFFAYGTYAQIAAQYGVKPCSINDIKKGLAWKHVVGSLLEKRPHVDRRTEQGKCYC